MGFKGVGKFPGLALKIDFVKKNNPLYSKLRRIAW
jgi:hypothetical protein